MSLYEIFSSLREPLVEKVEDQIAKLRRQFLERLLKDKATRNTSDVRQQEINFDWYLRYLDGVQIDLNQPGFRALPDLVERGKNTFNALVEADPSQQKKYLSWLLRLYWTQGLREEDFYKAKEYLDVLNRGRVKGFDINSVKNLPSLFRVVEPFLATKTQNQIGKDERDLINRETRIKYKGPEGMIVVPVTERASQFWGRGTQWCTAADKDCMFHDYSQRGDLNIIILPDGEKYQLHLTDGAFMDETDSPISSRVFVSRHPWVVRALNFGLSDLEKIRNIDPDTFAWFPNPLPFEIGKKLISLSPRYLSQIPNPSPEIVKFAVDTALLKDQHYREQEKEGWEEQEQHPFHSSDLPALVNWLDEHKGPIELVNRIIEFDPSLILHLHRNLRPETVWVALKGDPRVIDNIPEKMISFDMFEYAINRMPMSFLRASKSRGDEFFQLGAIAIRAISERMKSGKLSPDKANPEINAVLVHIGSPYWKSFFEYLFRKGLDVADFPEPWWAYAGAIKNSAMTPEIDSKARLAAHQDFHGMGPW